MGRHKRDSDSGAADSGGSWLASGERRAGAQPRLGIFGLKKKRGRLVVAFATTSLY
jgi:hypothetical protein